MSRMPPSRRGIRFQVGASVEARDSLKNWYAANIEKINYEDEKVLIHYRQWSHRYDEWFDWTSPYLRPVERVQLRREGLQEGSLVPGFRVNEKVLASWSDCRFYPAKVLSVNKDASYTVKFYDGVVQTVKEMHVKPFISEKVRQKSNPSNRNGEKPPFRRAEKHSSLLSNPSCRTRKTPPRTPPQDSEDDSEGEEGDTDEGAIEEWSRRKLDTRSIQKIRDVGRAESFLMREEDEEEEHERVVEYMGQHNYSKSFLKKTSPNGKLEELEDRSGTDTEHNPDSDSVERIENEDEKKEAELSELSEEEEVHPSQTRTSVGGPVGGNKRRSVREGGHSLKKIKTGPYIGEDGSECPVLSTQLCSDVVTQKSSQTDSSNIPTPVKSGRKQGFLNPNRFSREPLYRVIKNQLAPVLSVDLDHNPYKCSSPGCSKSFRKAKLLHYHRKYYHGEDRTTVEEICPNTSVLTGVKDQTGASVNWENPKQRGRITVSLPNRSACRSPSSSKAETRSSIQITERRRVSAPHMGGDREQQVRPSLKEKSRENPLDRTGCRSVEKSPVDIARVNRSKDRKSRSFLRIKLKKKKKKKKSKSGSEENVDISGFGLQTRPNLLRSPVSCKNPAESLLSRRGCGQAGRLELDDEDSVSDWSSDSYEWSDETGPDLKIISSRLSYGSGVSASVVDREAIRCVCKAEDENDFMIQCQECQCWQHGICMGLQEESTPDRYACFICRDPPGQNCGQRQSLQYWYDRDWLSSGHMYGLSFLKENYSHQNAGKILATHQLLGDVQHVVEVLSGLQLKISVLQNQTHPDLRLWCQPWKQTEQCQQNTHSVNSAHSKASMPQVLQRTETEEHLLDTPSTPSSFRNSYISSEHCYPKPWVFYPALEEQLVVERWAGSELEDSLQACKRVLQYEECYSGELQSSQTRTNQILDNCMSVVLAESGGELTQQQQWQINLLEHIESMQEEITHRMDFIEKELDVLESWLDCTGELEPPEPLDRLPELKHSVKQLMGELAKIQQIALACTT